MPFWRHICHRVRGQIGDGEPMAQTSADQPAVAQNLTIPRGAALYIGAILGPGLLLLPGLAAAEAGPASILAWLALLGLSGLFAGVFSALGRHIPSAGGVMGYVTAGLGSRAGRATGWMFLAGVVGGAPIVCIIGASYVTELTGGGQLARAAVAAGLLLTVIGLAAGGLRASAAAQLVLVSLLTVVVIVAAAGSARSAQAGNWTPFAPHGWPSVGSAAATLMFSFVGWEAVAPLTTRFAEPSRQLPPAVPGSRRPAPMLWLLAAIAAAGLLLITAYGLRIVAAAELVAVPTALFLTVYLGAMVAAARLLRGPARLAALPGALAVTVMLGFCGWALALPAAVTLAAGWRPRAAARRQRGSARPGVRDSLIPRPPERQLMASR